MPRTDWLRVFPESHGYVCGGSEHPNRIRAFLAKRQGGIDAEWVTDSIHYIHFLDFPAGCSFVSIVHFSLWDYCLKCYHLILVLVLFYSDYTLCAITSLSLTTISNQRYLLCVI